MPTTPQNEAGWRIEPPVSLPSAPGTMPAKGGQTQLSDEEVAAAVDFLVQQVEKD